MENQNDVVNSSVGDLIKIATEQAKIIKQLQNQIYVVFVVIAVVSIAGYIKIK